MAIENHVTTEEAAKILKVTAGRVRQLHVDKRLVGKLVGSMLFFPREQVQAFEKIKRSPGRPPGSRKKRK